MSFYAILFFGALLYINYRLSRSFLAPGSIFAAVWLMTAIGLFATQTYFFPISTKAYTIFFLGALAFCAGSLLVLHNSRFDLGEKKPISENRYSMHLLMDIVLAGVIIGFPFYWSQMMSLVQGLDPSVILTNLRYQMVNGQDQGQGFSIVNNLVYISMFLALIMHYHNDGSFKRKWRSFLAIGVAFAYAILSASKANPVELTLSLMFISLLRQKSFRLRPILTSIAIATAIFAVGLVTINFTYDTSGGSLSDKIQNNILVYWLGGPVAFNRIAMDPNAIERTQSLNRPLLQTANNLGYHFYVPTLHADFTTISASMNPDSTNVYTIYFSYFPDLGWLGVVFGLGLVGAAVAFVYRLAAQENQIALLLYSILAVGIIMSVASERFVLNFNELLKAIIFFFAIYYLPRVLPLPQRFDKASRGNA